MQTLEGAVSCRYIIYTRIYNFYIRLNYKTKPNTCIYDVESKPIMIFLYFRRPSLIAKDQKENITSTMDDVRGDFLGPPHSTTPAAVIANKNKTQIL